MIKLGIVSDLHSEWWEADEFDKIGKLVQASAADADLILLAGDIGAGAQAIQTAERLFPDKPVCLIAGNHEFYGRKVSEVLHEMQAASEASKNVRFLDRTTYTTTINGQAIRVLGATLWTDFALYGNAPLAMAQASFRTINGGQITTRYPDFSSYLVEDRLVTPQDHVEWHHRDREWLFNELDKPFTGLTVMMTHHVPVSFGIRRIYEGSPITPCFASALEQRLVRDDLNLVVFGHTHYSLDRTIDSTRFVSSQVGYLGRQLGRSSFTETGDFGMTLVLS